LRDGSKASATPSQEEKAEGEKARQDNPAENTEVTGAERTDPAAVEMDIEGNNDNAGKNDDKAGGNDGNAGGNDGNAGGNDGNAGGNDGNAGGNDVNAGGNDGNAGGNDGNARQSNDAGENDNNARENNDNVGGKDDNTREYDGKNDYNAGENENNTVEGDNNAGENDDNIVENLDNAMEEKGKAGVGTGEAGCKSDPLNQSAKQPPVGDVEALADELATIKVADECHNDTTLARESPQDLDLKENVESEPTPDIAQAGSISNTQRAQSLPTASEGTSPTAASNGSTSSKGASNAAISPDENVRLDSLQASIKKFCAPELLTGKNRFACIFCSKKKVEETTENEMLQTKSPQVRAATGEAENEVEVSHNEEEERNVSQCMEKESSLETQRSLPAPPNSESEAEETGPKSATCEHAEGTTSDLNLPDNQLGGDTKEGGESAGSEVSSSVDEGDNHEESNEENSHEESNKESDGKAKYKALDVSCTLLCKGSFSVSMPGDAVEEVPKKKAAAGKGREKECNVVFSEATKQLLIESPPLVLNLHLKRFLQLGRHLRKNNKHISFPTLLDMRPFCTAKCQVCVGLILGGSKFLTCS